jgi:hypothetical protein
MSEQAPTGDLNWATAFSPFTSPVITTPFVQIQFEHTLRFQIHFVFLIVGGPRRKASLCNRYGNIPSLLAHS